MPISLRLEPMLIKRLDDLAALTGRTKTYYMTQAIEMHLENLEDIYLAEQRLIDLRAGRSRAVPLDDVERELGLAD